MALADGQKENADLGFTTTRSWILPRTRSLGQNRSPSGDPSPQGTQRALSRLLTHPNCEVINRCHGRALHEMASTGEVPGASSKVHACDLQ